jgi:hypothetical protein
VHAGPVALLGLEAGHDAGVDDDEMDAVLARIRRRDAVRILITSGIVGLPLLAATVLGADFGAWGELTSAALQLSAFSAGVAALHLRRTRTHRFRMVDGTMRRR